MLRMEGHIIKVKKENVTQHYQSHLKYTVNPGISRCIKQVLPGRESDENFFVSIFLLTFLGICSDMLNSLNKYFGHFIAVNIRTFLGTSHQLFLHILQ